jgi:transcriptional regulator with XRE-family HTH domain
MNIDTLHKIAKFQGLTQSDLAEAAQVSRQAVSQWFNHKEAFVPVASNHLLNLSRAIGVSADVLLNEIADQDWWERETTNLLWDKLFLDLVDFLSALDQGDMRALARLVEVYGLFASAKMVGTRVWDDFSKYQNYLPPMRRKELEQLWQSQKSLHLI